MSRCPGCNPPLAVSSSVFLVGLLVSSQRVVSGGEPFGSAARASVVLPHTVDVRRAALVRRSRWSWLLTLTPLCTVRCGGGLMTARRTVRLTFLCTLDRPSDFTSHPHEPKRNTRSSAPMQDCESEKHTHTVLDVALRVRSLAELRAA